VKPDNKKVLINLRGEPISDECDRIFKFSNGMAEYIKGNERGYLNNKGEKFTINGIRRQSFQNGFAIIKKDEVSSVIDKNGNILYSFNGEIFSLNNDSIIKLKNKKKYGIFNISSNKIILPVEYEYISYNLNSNHHVIRRNDSSLVINDMGKVLFSFDGYPDYGYHENYMKVCKWKNGPFLHFIDTTGTVIMSNENQFDYVGTLYNGFVKVKKKHKYGFSDIYGNVIIPIIYKNVDFFQDGICRVQTNSAIEYINSNGKVIFKHRFLESFWDFKYLNIYHNDFIKYNLKEYPYFINSFLSNHHDINPVLKYKKKSYSFAGRRDIFMVENDNKIALMYKTGQIVTIWYDDIKSISESDYVLIKLNGKYGYMSKETLSEHIKPQYDDAFIKLKKNETTFVKMNNKWALIDDSNKIIVDFIFENFYPFSEGLAAVKMNGKWGFIDLNGKIKIKFIYNDALSFQNGKAQVKLNNKWIIINKEGKII
jgi:hypothetical protein